MAGDRLREEKAGVAELRGSTPRRPLRDHRTPAGGRSPAAPLSSELRVAARRTSSSSYPSSGRVVRRRVSPTPHARHQDSAVAALPRRRCCSSATGCPPAATPWSSAPHPPSLAGESPADPLGPTCGLRSPDASSPTSAHLSGRAGVADRRSALRAVAREPPGCPRTLGFAPVSSSFPLHRAPYPPRSDGRTSDRSDHVSPCAPFVARGSSRAPNRSSASRHPQATHGPEA